MVASEEKTKGVRRMVTGKTLISLGYKPGKWFREAIEVANSLNLEGKALTDYLDAAQEVEILPHDRPIAYHENMEGNTEEELANMSAVCAAMYEVMKTPTVVDGAVMPDACPVGGVGNIPVGGIVVTKNALHPSMHSADICCSVMLTNLGQVDPKKVLDIGHTLTHFGPGGRKDKIYALPKELEDKMLNNSFLNDTTSIVLAHSHLGTQGDGNHFMFVGVSEETGDTCLVTHHGSRGLGARLYKEGMRVAEKFRRNLSPKTIKRNAWIPFDTKEGKSYWEALQIVREWTKLNHTCLHEHISLLALAGTGKPKERFWNEHNFIFKDGDLFYHAKGATPLDDKFTPDSTNGLRIIPLNMAEPILVVRGTTTETNLGFAPHGAGRNVSRAAHKRSKVDKSDEEIFQEETTGLDIRFFSGNIDISELPSAYKDAEAVQKQMTRFKLGEVVDRIQPYGCIMAGDWEKDKPWRSK